MLKSFTHFCCSDLYLLSIIQLKKQDHIEGRINLQCGLQLVLPLTGDEFYYILGSILKFEISIIF
jgi:hypothetical protein